jgi:hypothetical protein
VVSSVAKMTSVANARRRTGQSETVAKADDEFITPTSKSHPSGVVARRNCQVKNDSADQYSAFDTTRIANSAASASSSVMVVAGKENRGRRAQARAGQEPDLVRCCAWAAVP